MTRYFVPIVPGLIIALLIFLVILANEFADAEADRAVNKKTIVAQFGTTAAVWVYKIVLLVLSLLTAINIFITPNMLSQTVFLMILIVLSLSCMRFLNVEKLSGKGYTALSRATILMHLIAGLTLASGLLLSKIV